MTGICNDVSSTSYLLGKDTPYAMKGGIRVQQNWDRQIWKN